MDAPAVKKERRFIIPVFELKGSGSIAERVGSVERAGTRVIVHFERLQES